MPRVIKEYREILRLASVAAKWMRNQTYKWLLDRQEKRKQGLKIDRIDTGFLEIFEKQTLSTETTRKQLNEVHQAATDFEQELIADEELFQIEQEQADFLNMPNDDKKNV